VAPWGGPPGDRKAFVLILLEPSAFCDGRARFEGNFGFSRPPRIKDLGGPFAGGGLVWIAAGEGKGITPFAPADKTGALAERGSFAPSAKKRLGGGAPQPPEGKKRTGDAALGEKTHVDFSSCWEKTLYCPLGVPSAPTLWVMKNRPGPEGVENRRLDSGARPKPRGGAPRLTAVGEILAGTPQARPQAFAPGRVLVPCPGTEMRAFGPQSGSTLYHIWGVDQKDGRTPTHFGDAGPWGEKKKNFP